MASSHARNSFYVELGYVPPPTLISTLDRMCLFRPGHVL